MGSSRGWSEPGVCKSDKAPRPARPEKAVGARADAVEARRSRARGQELAAPEVDALPAVRALGRPAFAEPFDGHLFTGLERCQLLLVLVGEPEREINLRGSRDHGQF